MAEKDQLLVDVRDHICYLTINRPERRNAYDIATRDLLIQHFIAANNDNDVWAIVLTGSGDKAFCAGRDLKELNTQAAEGQRIGTPMEDVTRNLTEVVLETYKPTIAVLNGSAIAGGCELALACDIRLAAETASLQMPEALRGMGANAASVLLFKLIPRALAFEMLYTSRAVSAEEAFRWGLINAYCPQDELNTMANDFVERLLAGAPLSLRRYKEMAIKGWDLPVPAALRLNVGPNPYTSNDRAEGVRAFVEKRPPVWTNS